MPARATTTIRPATESDYRLFARLFPALEIDDPVPSREHFVATYMSGAVIAEVDGDGVGYASGRLLADMGHLIHIIVDERVRGRGVGRALMLAIAQRFREAGKRRWCLNVRPENARAIALYESLGMSIQYASSVLRFSWSEAKSWPETAGGPARAAVRPDDDAAVERGLDIAPGLLAERRGQSDYVLVGLRDDGRWVGCAAFSPGHPGAFPFRVARPELSVALLRALEEHASSDPMQVVIEDAAATRDYLVALGAREVLQILHLRGELSA